MKSLQPGWSKLNVNRLHTMPATSTLNNHKGLICNLKSINYDQQFDLFIHGFKPKYL